MNGYFDRSEPNDTGVGDRTAESVRSVVGVEPVEPASDDQPSNLNDPGEVNKVTDAMSRVIRTTLGPGWLGPERALGGVSVEDVLQEAFLTLLCSGNFDGGSFTAFAKHIAHDTAVDQMRRQFAQKRGAGRVESTDTLALDGGSDSSPGIARSVNVEEEAIAILNFGILLELVSELLEPAEQEVFLESIYYRRKLKDIAKERDITPQRVSQLKTSAMRKLKRDQRYPFSHNTK